MKYQAITLCFLMDFPIHYDTKVTISTGLPIVYFKVSQVEFSKIDVFLSMKVVLS